MNDNVDLSRSRNIICIELAAEIISAYVSNNSLPAAELPALIAITQAALTALSEGTAVETGVDKATPAQIRRSVTPEALISFEDGKSYKALKRHLTIRGLTPEAYRTKWGLPADYPMTSAAYSEARSALAQSLGLGRKRKDALPKAAQTAETVAEAPSARGRKKAAEAPAKPAGGRKAKAGPEAAPAE